MIIAPEFVDGETHGADVARRLLLERMKMLGADEEEVCDLPSAVAAAACGAVAAHEVLKAASKGGLGCPFESQFLLFDATAEVGLRPKEPKKKKKVFVVGCGATGCEILKNLAMVGVEEVVATDDDSVEVSNLARQFLFRSKDVGSNKASTACSRAESLGRRTTRFEAHERRLDDASTAPGGPFDARFFKSLDCVFSALDNVEARRYIDSLCVKYGVPLVDCGTLGGSGSVQTVVPHLTESYSAAADPEDAAVALCTLKHHPYKAEHVVMWAKALFDQVFGERLRVANEGLDAAAAHAGGVRAWVRTKLGAQRADALETLKFAADDVEGLARPRTALQAAEWAGRLYAELATRPIRDLLNKHAFNAVDDEGAPFWSGTRVRPRIVPLDDSDSDDDARAFVKHAVTLRQRSLGMLASGGEDDNDNDNDDAALMAAAQRGYEAFIHEEAAADGPRTTTLDDEVARFEVAAARLLKEKKADGAQQRPLVADFAKDDPLAFHVEFIAACANLRGAAFGIEGVSALRAKQIAGSVVPAIATTTAAVSALATLEFLKLASEGARFKNTFVNLRSNIWSQSEPFEAEAWNLADGRQVTEWTVDEVRLGKQERFGALLKRLEAACGTDLISVSRKDDDTLLYLSFLPEELDLSARAKLLADLPKPDPAFVDLTVVADDDDSRPPIRVWL